MSARFAEQNYRYYKVSDSGEELTLLDLSESFRFSGKLRPGIAKCVSTLKIRLF